MYGTPGSKRKEIESGTKETIIGDEQTNKKNLNDNVQK